jgi:acyl carrier protein
METKKVKLENGSVLNLTGKDINEYTEVEITISKIIAELLENDVLDVNESLIQQGTDSLGVLEIAQNIEDVYHIEITPEEMTKNVNVVLIAKLVEKKSKELNI